MTTDLYLGLARVLQYGFSLECASCASVQCSPPGMKPALAVRYLLMNGWTLNGSQPLCRSCRPAESRTADS